MYTYIRFVLTLAILAASTPAFSAFLPGPTTISENEREFDTHGSLVDGGVTPDQVLYLNAGETVRAEGDRLITLSTAGDAYSVDLTADNVVLHGSSNIGIRFEWDIQVDVLSGNPVFDIRVGTEVEDPGENGGYWSQTLLSGAMGNQTLSGFKENALLTLVPGNLRMFATIEFNSYQAGDQVMFTLPTGTGLSAHAMVPVSGTLSLLLVSALAGFGRSRLRQMKQRR